METVETVEEREVVERMEGEGMEGEAKGEVKVEDVEAEILSEPRSA